MNNKTLDKDRIRNDLIRAMLTHVPFDGWTWKAMEQGAIDIGFEKKKTSSLRIKIFKDLYIQYMNSIQMTQRYLLNLAG